MFLGRECGRGDVFASGVCPVVCRGGRWPSAASTGGNGRVGRQPSVVVGGLWGEAGVQPFWGGDGPFCFQVLGVGGAVVGDGVAGAAAMFLARFFGETRRGIACGAYSMTPVWCCESRRLVVQVLAWWPSSLGGRFGGRQAAQEVGLPLAGWSAGRPPAGWPAGKLAAGVLVVLKSGRRAVVAGGGQRPDGPTDRTLGGAAFPVGVWPGYG